MLVILLYALRECIKSNQRDPSAGICRRCFPQTSHLQQLVITHEHSVKSCAVRAAASGERLCPQQLLHLGIQALALRWE